MEQPCALLLSTFDSFAWTLVQRVLFCQLDRSVILQIRVAPRSCRPDRLATHLLVDHAMDDFEVQFRQPDIGLKPDSRKLGLGRKPCDKDGGKTTALNRIEITVVCIEAGG